MYSGHMYEISRNYLNFLMKMIILLSNINRSLGQTFPETSKNMHHCVANDYPKDMGYV